MINKPSKNTLNFKINMIWPILYILFFTSCAHYKLTQEELKWNPYQVGEIMSYVNSSGKKMEMIISSLNKSSNKINPYAGNFSGKHEQLMVNYKFKNGQPDSEIHTLLAIGKNPKGEGFFNPILELPKLIHISDPISFEALQRKPKKQLTIRGKAYHDLIVFNPASPTETLAYPHINKLYWSISKGCVKFNLSDNTSWELTN
jgi:hypothetical protein